MDEEESEGGKKMILEILLLALAIPVGYLVAWLARDELVQGKIYFKALIVFSFLAGFWFFLTGFNYLAWTFGFIFIVSMISHMKSSDKKWTKKR
jgi:hypothetical protein